MGGWPSGPGSPACHPRLHGFLPTLRQRTRWNRKTAFACLPSRRRFPTVMLSPTAKRHDGRLEGAPLLGTGINSHPDEYAVEAGWASCWWGWQQSPPPRRGNLGSTGGHSAEREKLTYLV
jgi:hypothetical protein